MELSFASSPVTLKRREPSLELKGAGHGKLLEFKTRSSHSDGSPIGPGRCLVSPREVIRRLVEEVSNQVVELLDGVEFDGHQLIRGDAIAGEGDKAVLADESASSCRR